MHFKQPAAIALGMTNPHIITCCLGIYGVSGNWDIPAHGAGDGGGPPPPAPPPWVRFSFFFKKKKKKKKKNKKKNCFQTKQIFSFSKLKGGQNGFKRGGKNFLKKGGWEKNLFFSKKGWDYLLQAVGVGKFWGGFVFFCLGVGFFSTCMFSTLGWHRIVGY